MDGETFLIRPGVTFGQCLSKSKKKNMVLFLSLVFYTVNAVRQRLGRAAPGFTRIGRTCCCNQIVNTLS